MKKGDKEFKLLSMETTLSMLDKANIIVDRMIVHERFAMNLDMIRKNIPLDFLSNVSAPFYINDNRLLRLKTGTGRLELNLTEYTVSAGDVIIIREGSCIEIKEISEDATAEVLVFVPDKYPTNLSFCSEMMIHIHPSKTEWNEISHLLYTIYSFALGKEYCPDVVEPLIQSLINHIVGINERNRKHTDSRAAQIFSRFIEELNKSEMKKLPVTHYAAKLCITPQYLSRIVSQISGKSAMDWINKAVILNAKMLLKEQDRTIGEIAEMQNFPSDSFFCRFFKRETGLTPTEYRRS